MSLGLFGATNQIEHFQPTPHSSRKNILFRQEIRRRHNSEKFKAVRQQLMQSLMALHFLETLKSQPDNYTAKRIHQLTDGLQMGLNDSEFYRNLVDLQLEHYLCEMLANPELKIIDKVKILHTLVELTYFCNESLEAIIENNIIDSLVKEMKSYTMQTDDEESFAYFAAALTINLIHSDNKDFILFLMESDFIFVLHDLLEKSTRKQDNLIYYRSDLREKVLQVYKQLSASPNYNQTFVNRSIFRLFNDHRNSQNQYLITILLNCLSNAAYHPQIWRSLEKNFSQYGQLLTQLEDVIETMKALMQKEKDLAMAIDHLISIPLFLYEESIDLSEQGDLILSLFGPLMFFTQYLYNLDKGSSKKTLLKMFKLISYAMDSKSQNLVLLRNEESIEEFLNILANKNFILHPFSGKYPIQIMWKLLKDRKVTIDMLVDYGIYDSIRDILDSQRLEQSKIQLIQLIEIMIDTQEGQKQRNTPNRLLNGFHDRGITKDIEKLQDHELRPLFERAEAFLKHISEIDKN